MKTHLVLNINLGNNQSTVIEDLEHGKSYRFSVFAKLDRGEGGVFSFNGLPLFVVNGKYYKEFVYSFRAVSNIHISLTPCLNSVLLIDALKLEQI